MSVIAPGEEASYGYLSISFNMEVCCVFSLESSHRGDSNEYTQHTTFNILKKITLNYPKSTAIGFFPGTQERVRNSRGKQAISVRATEVLLYVFYNLIYHMTSLNSVTCCAHFYVIFFPCLQVLKETQTHYTNTASRL